MILEVDAAAARETGLVIMQAGKTVFLVDRVPADLLRRAEESVASSPAADGETP